MAIVITSLAKPENVVATLQAGGTLLANQTYYLVVTAINVNQPSYYIGKTGVKSAPSTEISFTTDSTNRSVNVTWDAVTGAAAYNVYISTTSSYFFYINGGGKYGGGTTTTTNSYTITTPPNYGVMDTLGISLPGNISGWLGTIRVDISGNETLQSIYDAIVAAGFGDYVYKDSSIFAIKGTAFETDEIKVQRLEVQRSL